MFQKIREEKILNYIKSSCIIFYAKMTRYSQKFLNYNQVFLAKYSNTLILFTLKALLSKSWFYFAFLILRHAKKPPSFSIPRYWH